MYWNFDILYVVIEPDMLRQCEGLPWKENLEFPLEDYLDAYSGSPSGPGRFRCGKREYFEVPVEQIPKLGGLSTLISFLHAARSIWPEDRPPRGPKVPYKTYYLKRYRLMTWRDL